MSQNPGHGAGRGHRPPPVHVPLGQSMTYEQAIEAGRRRVAQEQAAQQNGYHAGSRSHSSNTSEIPRSGSPRQAPDIPHRELTVRRPLKPTIPEPAPENNPWKPLARAKQLIIGRRPTAEEEIAAMHREMEEKARAEALAKARRERGGLASHPPDGR